MKLLALCPTYGRSSEMLRNTLALFDLQEHDDKYLIIYDDHGNISGKGETWEVISTDKREPNLPNKYNVMLKHTDYDWDAVVIWDDDDIYFPNHLRLMNEYIPKGGWAKPASVSYNTGAKPLIKKDSGHNRFWATIGISRALVEKVPFENKVDASFDIKYLAKLKKVIPETTIPKEHITFMYRWWNPEGHHSSAYSNKPSWYTGFKPKFYSKVHLETGQLDKYTEKILDKYYKSGKVVM